MTVIHTEIHGSVRKLAALAKKHGFPYKPGDRVFRRRDTKTGESNISAYRTLYAKKPVKGKTRAKKTRLTKTKIGPRARARKTAI